MNKIGESFFNQDSHLVARELLGNLLVRKYPDGTEKRGRITEVEVYQGFSDKASHASKNKTRRNEVMFGKAGHYYIYLIYGMYYCLNIVTEGEEFPAAILIRALEPIGENVDTKGPGKLCRWMGIDKELNGYSVESNELFLKVGNLKQGEVIKTATRIGVSYAGESANFEWRYYL